MIQSKKIMFQEAKRKRVFEDVVEQIQEAILQGKIGIGEKLPAERELQTLFKTSRGTLREALRVLEQRGLLEIKRGVSGGAVVRKVPLGVMSESFILLVRSQRVPIKHLIEFRRDIEGRVAALAAERASAEDIERLKSLLEEASQHLAGNEVEWEAFLRLDKQLHLEFANISGNPLYISIFQAIHENIARYYETYLPKIEEHHKEEYKNLCEIVQAIEERDPARAASLAEYHVFHFASDLGLGSGELEVESWKLEVGSEKWEMGS